MYKKRLCRECDGITIAEDVCSKCRKKNYVKKETHSSRAFINEQAIIEQSMTLDQAMWLYSDASNRLLIDDKDKKAWHDKRRARARLDLKDPD
jgi:hypothetical protein